jgi:hypothetical protein
MRKEFIPTESYKHLCAKEVLAGWLRDIEKGKDFCELNPIKWRSNYGVFTELPFYETSDPYYFELSKGIKTTKSGNLSHRGKNPLNWYDKSVDRGRILFVPDITVFHKGTAVHLIEVVHKNPVSDYKLRTIQKFFSHHSVHVWEIPADWILSQVKMPQTLIASKLLATV